MPRGRTHGRVGAGAWSSNPNTVYTPGFGHRSNGINSFYQVDWLGSTRYVTDITGSSVLAAPFYDAWGNGEPPRQTGQTWPSDLQWAGGFGYQTEWNNGPSEEGLGLDYLQQRYYDPVIGRFISPDPTGFAAGNNLYLYAGDDPASGVDPAGLDTLVIQQDPGGAGFGAHARIYLSGWDEQPENYAAAPPTAGRWYGYYPANPNGNRGSSSLWDAIKESIGSIFSRGGGNGPGFVQAYDTPGTDQWQKGNHVFVPITHEQGLKIFAEIDKKPTERYNLDTHNCSTWAGEVLLPAFPNVPRIKTPKQLFDFFSTGSENDGPGQ